MVPASFNITLAFTAGMLAAFNPCGIVLLPPYISYLISSSKIKNTDDKKILKLLSIGIKIGFSLTAGFILIFMIIGLGFSLLGATIMKITPWISVIMGVVLVTGGCLFLFKPELLHKINLNSFITSGSKIKQKNAVSTFLYGIGYALVSLGCSLPVFSMVVFTSFTTGSFSDGMINFFFYSTGMGFVVIIISILALFAQKTIQKWLKKALPYIQKLTAFFLLLAGIYLIYYWVSGTGSTVTFF